MYVHVDVGLTELAVSHGFLNIVSKSVIQKLHNQKQLLIASPFLRNRDDSGDSKEG